MGWTQSIKNHIYWSASSTPTGDPELMLEKFLSIENHIQNKHSDLPAELFVKCAYEPISAKAERTKAWLESGEFIIVLGVGEGDFLEQVNQWLFS